MGCARSFHYKHDLAAVVRIVPGGWSFQSIHLFQILNKKEGLRDVDQETACGWQRRCSGAWQLKAMASPGIRLAMGVFFTTCLFAPMLQQWTGLLPVQPLAGAELDAENPPWTFRGWASGTYQRAVEECLSQRVGFRSWFIKTYNQMNFSFFREVSSSRGTKIVIGRDNWLYEKAYVERYNDPRRASDVAIQQKAEQLRRLQELLARRGIAFIFVIAPSKAEVYPDYLPPALVRGRRRDSERLPSDYERMLAALHQMHVHVVDGRNELLKLKAASGLPVFAKTGTHWNYYAALRCLQAILAQARSFGSTSVPALIIDGFEMRLPQGRDNDLGALLNIWRMQPLLAPLPYAHYRPQPVQAGNAPNLLIVGDSFSDILIDLFMGRPPAGGQEASEEERLINRIDFLYYNRTLIRHPGGERLHVDPRHELWGELLKGKAAVIVEMTEILLPEDAWGFVGGAIEHLETDAEAK